MKFIPDFLSAFLALGAAIITSLSAATVLSLTIQPDGSIYSFLKDWQALIAAGAAIAIGAYSIKAVRDQIADAKDAREEQRKDAARIYLAAVVSYLTQANHALGNTASLNREHPNQEYIVVHRVSYESVKGEWLTQFINDWKNYACLPQGLTKKFLQLRLDIEISLQVIDVASERIDQNGHILVRHKTWDKFCDIFGEKFLHLDATIKEFYKESPDLEP